MVRKVVWWPLGAVNEQIECPLRGSTDKPVMPKAEEKR
jgi:hypothetical protein